MEHFEKIPLSGRHKKIKNIKSLLFNSLRYLNWEVSMLEGPSHRHGIMAALAKNNTVLRFV